MSGSPLSDFDRDRVVVTLRRVGAITRELRQEYPDAFAGARAETAGASAEPEPARAAHPAA